MYPYFFEGRSIERCCLVFCFFLIIPLEIFSKLILADSTTNQTKLFHGNSTPSWLQEQHDKEVCNSASRQWAPYGFWPKMRTEPWEGVLIDMKAMKFYIFHYIYNKINIKYRDVCITPRLAWYSYGWMVFTCKTQIKDWQGKMVTELLLISAEGKFHGNCILCSYKLPVLTCSSPICVCSPPLTAAKTPPLLKIIGKDFHELKSKRRRIFRLVLTVMLSLLRPSYWLQHLFDFLFTSATKRSKTLLQNLGPGWPREENSVTPRI